LEDFCGDSGSHAVKAASGRESSPQMFRWSQQAPHHSSGLLAQAAMAEATLEIGGF